MHDEHPAVTVRDGNASTTPRVITPLENPKIFRPHTSTFSRNQAQREASFATQLHKFHSEIAAVEIQAQQTFRGQQQSFQATLDAKHHEYATGIQSLLEECDRQWARDEVARQERFYAEQRYHRENFEDAQTKRHVKFQKTFGEIQQEAEAEEARRVRDFQNWKEMKVYEVERKLQGWRRRFEADEKKRERSVDELLALFERQQVNLKS